MNVFIQTFSFIKPYQLLMHDNKIDN